MNKISQLILTFIFFPILTFAQNLTFNQMVGILQKLKNNNHTIINVIDRDLKVNSPVWQLDGKETTILMEGSQLESFVYAWTYRVDDQEFYRLGVSKSPVNGKVFTSLSYWFPSEQIYYDIKNKAIEFGAVETNKRIQEDGRITFQYQTTDYELDLTEIPPEGGDLTVNGKKVVTYQAVVGYR